ncbi:hypothetical protein F0U60_22745 [Archangium minus]|uniref:Lipoprotein n=1 Tax=Archangium minus TaxID=83450 RepID=A0ABY9WUP6_9BACT|nr:hypothetical protein F0U61_22850 [Archangium violaceum]WNG46616.1 hypothetical protein F0U60_22745 [Archangium minus]
MLGSLLVMVLAAGEPTAELTKYQVKTIALQVPSDWKQSEADGTQRFDAPSGDAYLLLDVGAVQTAGMKPQVCLDKVLAAMGSAQGWKQLKVGKAPAARRVDSDTTPDGAESVETVTYVGCDGKTTWSLVFHMNAKKRDRFETLADKVAGSVAYAKSPARKGK